MRCHFTLNLEKVQRGLHFEKDPSKGTNVLLETSTSRERPISALYLRLKIVKGAPFGLCETPVGCKI